MSSYFCGEEMSLNLPQRQQRQRIMKSARVFWWLIISKLVSEVDSHFEEEDGSKVKRLSLENNQIIEFEAKDIVRSGIYNPEYWTEMNERSTSANYTLWKDADVHLVEWPGNITVRDAEWPLLRWKKPRAKFLINRCCEAIVGIEMRAYAYRHLFLTWGPFRFTMTSSPPLTIPAQLLRNHTNGHDYDHRHRLNPSELSVSDFAFVHDALLLAMFEDGIVARVYGLEMAYVPIGENIEKSQLEPLKYSVAKGISSPVNKLITQHCCAKSEAEECPHGETVLAYREYSSDFRIFFSTDGGEHFKLLQPSVPKQSLVLHTAFSYPDTGRFLLLHGTENSATLDTYSMSSGALISGGKSAPSSTKFNGISGGMLQGSRIGEEMSLIIWDKCNVWYSLGEGRNVTKAVFYVNGFILGKRKKHYIMAQYCKFGSNSAIAISNTGKLALLDADNHFHFGVDTKTKLLQLVSLKVDMSLVLEKHSMSIVPHFDHNQHPKLVYPPRYLELPDKALLPRNYSQRLGIRLLPKTLFPTEFITIFYEENAWLPKKFKNFALRPCQTSSISVNRSISQKPKFYTFKPNEEANFTIRFKSRLNSTRQLNYEPISVNKFLHVGIKLLSREPDERDSQYWFSYRVVIKPRSSKLTRRIFLINFFTWKTLRCNIQPSSPVYVIINELPPKSQYPRLTEKEMSMPSFVKVNDQKPRFSGNHHKSQVSSNCKKEKSKMTMPNPLEFRHPWMMHGHSEL